MIYSLTQYITMPITYSRLCDARPSNDSRTADTFARIYLAQQEQRFSDSAHCLTFVGSLLSYYTFTFTNQPKCRESYMFDAHFSTHLALQRISFSYYKKFKQLHKEHTEQVCLETGENLLAVIMLASSMYFSLC